MTLNDTFQEIASITQLIIENGLSIEEKWPSKKDNKISWNDQKDISIALKNVEYDKKFEVLSKDKNYNLKMLDGALIQMMYEFNNTGRNLISHRLAFFPSPKHHRYDENIELYDEKYFGESEFHDIIEKNIIAFPIRFDFNSSADIFIDIDHPYSHSTFGEYQNCRIPVSGPITPSSFMHFIVKNFYFNAYKKNDIIWKVSDLRFQTTISKNEEKTLHLNIN
ncbi:DUF2290 domain-containing protein [Flavobacterium sp. UBA7682]|uniref:DUF2290 domain-containing protein n=1 Tax=Flavobacterium sp. UBA7682 TaxID=1946560 RepID=UPI0025C0978E|nr:DUF2290 domain-containing protein [Flavobacterium sp. UBA7682]